MTTDIIDAIDEVTAPTCGWCTRPLAADGPSEYFCDAQCQHGWQQLRGDRLTNYVEPTDLAAYVANQVEQTSPETTPRRQLPSLSNRRPTATERGTVALDVGELFVNDGARWRSVGSAGIAFPSATRTVAELASAMMAAIQPLGEHVRRLNEQISLASAVVRQLQAAAVLPPDTPLGPQARALQLRRRRNTGPQQQRRAPRTIEPRRCR